MSVCLQLQNAHSRGVNEPANGSANMFAEQSIFRTFNLTKKIRQNCANFNEKRQFRYKKSYFDWEKLTYHPNRDKTRESLKSYWTQIGSFDFEIRLTQMSISKNIYHSRHRVQHKTDVVNIYTGNDEAFNQI